MQKQIYERVTEIIERNQREANMVFYLLSELLKKKHSLTTIETFAHRYTNHNSHPPTAQLSITVHAASILKMK